MKRAKTGGNFVVLIMLFFTLKEKLGNDKFYAKRMLSFY